MTLDSKIYTLDEFKEHDNLEFSQTHINVLYKSFFDSPCHDNSYSYDHCEPDKSYERIKQQHRELYKKFERNLKIITYKTEHYENFETNKDKLCFYLKYWFYDNLISKSVTQDEFENFLALWNEQKSEKCKECDCQFEINKISAIKELKSIYDYFLFTDAYKKISKINNEISKKIYCQYIDNAKIKYSLDKEICAKRSDHYCREFKKYIEKYLVQNQLKETKMKEQKAKQKMKQNILLSLLLIFIISILLVLLFLIFEILP
ncbi:hypothetical protein PVBG_06338 [Plasmodium vivax Brazil I]|uniref:Variable surface protein n=1 Tax=Plasmodium vivax (strain Brazil I) TaxID=1033975 RepID=A0A0J9SJP2_PLAV1|nr:hypothetical protein PVBG_06338 [Plasmodium vivax Brazil I]